MRDQRGFFDVDERLKRLSDLGDQLEVFQSAVDFEMFRPQLNAVLSYSDGSQGGRPPFDPVMMFKILVIQAVNDLSDERTEFLINDRLSFRRFLGLSLADRVPDARTIWLFREKLTKAGAIRGLFERFDATLRAAGYIAMSGQIVDASLIAAPKQRNTQEEKKAMLVGDRMGRVRQRLALNSDPGQTTQTIEDRIIDDLDMLIEQSRRKIAQARNQPPGQGQGEQDHARQTQDEAGDRRGMRPAVQDGRITHTDSIRERRRTNTHPGRQGS